MSVPIRCFTMCFGSFSRQLRGPWRRLRHRECAPEEPQGVRTAVEQGYFDRLGVTTLWLSPLGENAPGTQRGRDGNLYEAYHGYWPAQPRSVEPKLGTAADLEQLVQSAHQHGLRVILMQCQTTCTSAIRTTKSTADCPPQVSLIRPKIVVFRRSACLRLWQSGLWLGRTDRGLLV